MKIFNRKKQNIQPEMAKSKNEYSVILDKLRELLKKFDAAEADKVKKH